MPARQKILFIVNPVASAGKALRRWEKLYPRIKQLLPETPLVEHTSGPGRGYEIAKEAVSRQVQAQDFPAGYDEILG